MRQRLATGRGRDDRNLRLIWGDVVTIGSALPGVEIGTSYGTPALKVGGKLLVRLRPEDDSLALLGVSPDERAMLIEAAPHIFHTTPHYRDHPAVLARLATVEPDAVRGLLERRWRTVAPRHLTRDHPPAPPG